MLADLVEGRDQNYYFSKHKEANNIRSTRKRKGKKTKKQKERMGLYAAVMDSIGMYTGLSPAAFFTIAALMVAVYKTVCGMFLGPEDFKKPVREPVQVGDVSEQELRAYNGSDPNKPLLMAIKGQIYDVSSSRMFYGPGGPYAMFAGRDASRALALLSFNPRDITGNLEGLGESELEILQDWEDKFMDKYAKVGQLVPEKTRQQL